MDQVIVSDTNMIIDFFSEVEPGASIVSTLIEQNGLALTSITVFELYAGVVGKKRLLQIEELVNNAIVLPLDGVDARIGSEICTRLKAKGKLIDNQDILISAVCIRHDLPLATRNITHFSRVPGLRIAKGIK